MIEGFRDPEIHLAVLDENRVFLVASDNYRNLGITPHTEQTLTTLTLHKDSDLIKGTIPTGKVYLPAATGQLSQDPVMNLLFVVETAIGTLDPFDDRDEENDTSEQTAVETPVAIEAPQEDKFETLLEDI